MRSQPAHHLRLCPTWNVFQVLKTLEWEKECLPRKVILVVRLSFLSHHNFLRWSFTSIWWRRGAVIRAKLVECCQKMLQSLRKGRNLRMLRECCNNWIASLTSGPIFRRLGRSMFLWHLFVSMMRRMFYNFSVTPARCSSLSNCLSWYICNSGVF